MCEQLTVIFISDFQASVPYLVGFVEKHAEIGEYHPELLPAIAVFELSQKVSRELVLKMKRDSAANLSYVICRWKNRLMENRQASCKIILF